MRADYLDSFDFEFEYGLKTLKTEGLVYKNANHFHANTTTAAGHATLATGTFPSHSSIVGNDVYNRETNEWEYSILDTSIQFVGLENCNLEKVSAKNLETYSIGDHLKINDSESKSYSVALKDRAAILMGGKNANRAYWFDTESTQMVSSDYYSSPFPEWVKTFTGKIVMAEEMEYGWEKSADLQAISTTSPDSFYNETGKMNAWFPHTLSNFAADVPANKLEGDFLWLTPFGDQFALKFSEQLILNEELGKDKNCDMLTVGLSSADYIGHHFGPNSLEILDYYNKLDEYLGSYIQFLDENIGKKKYVLVLSADHGVVPFPEISASQGIDAKRISKDRFQSDMSLIDQELQVLFNLDQTTFKNISSTGVEPNFEYLTTKNIDSLIYIEQLSDLLKNLDYIAEVYSDFDIYDSSCQKMYIEEMRNSYYSGKNMFVQFISKPYYLINYKQFGTSHGTPYDYDTRVPLLFYGKGIKPKTVIESVRTVDLAPTVLDILNIEPSLQLDGKSLIK